MPAVLISTKVDIYFLNKIRRLCKKQKIKPYKWFQRAVYWYFLFSKKHTDKEMMLENEVEDLRGQVHALSNEVMELQRQADITIPEDCPYRDLSTVGKELRTTRAEEAVSNGGQGEIG